MNRRRFDDFGQVDGDGAGPSPFATSMQAQPWVRTQLPPWHMWGNTIPIKITQFETEVAAPPVITGQLIKVSYGRPETWHWVFSAKVLNAPVTDDPVNFILDLHFDIILGHGRSQIQLPDFEFYRWSWLSIAGTGDATPLAPKWSTDARTPSLVDSIVPPIGPVEASRRLVDQITAQDIQLSCRAHCIKDDETVGELNMEVSAYFAPKTHVRPDWYLPEPAPIEAQFPGGETGHK